MAPRSRHLLPAREQRQQENAQVEPERPVADVIVIVIDAALHRFVGVSLAAEAVDLRPAGGARQQVTPPRAKRDLPLVFAIVRQRVRTRADRTTAIWPRCLPEADALCSP